MRIAAVRVVRSRRARVRRRGRAGRRSRACRRYLLAFGDVHDPRSPTSRRPGTVTAVRDSRHGARLGRGLTPTAGSPVRSNQRFPGCGQASPGDSVHENALLWGEDRVEVGGLAARARRRRSRRCGALGPSRRDAIARAGAHRRHGRHDAAERSGRERRSSPSAGGGDPRAHGLCLVRGDTCRDPRRTPRATRVRDARREPPHLLPARGRGDGIDRRRLGGKTYAEVDLTSRP